MTPYRIRNYAVKGVYKLKEVRGVFLLAARFTPYA
jgi:hypothetical protein